MKQLYALLAATVILMVGVSAQNPVLLKDIRSAVNGSSITSNCNYTLINGITYFIADDGIHGKELWKTDGTEAGTVMVKDIYPGLQSSYLANLTNANGTLFFTAVSSYSFNMELWKSDGTEAGTVMVKDIWPGGDPSQPKYLTVVNGTLFFQAMTAANGKELWKSDGTAAGTVMVKDIVPGAFTSDPRNLVNVNGTLFFTAISSSSSSSRYDLWKSDGTADGTVKVKEVLVGSNSAFNIDEMVNLDGTLFFQGNDSINGKELWKSDGTEAGTVMVKNISPSGESNPNGLTAVDSILYFAATDGSEGNVYRLWKSDGTPEGTTMMKDTAGNKVTVVNILINVANASSLINFNGTLFFTGSNEDGTGIEPWKTDGTPAGTMMLKDIAPGNGDSYPRRFTRLNNDLYFITTSDSIGLWKTDGTTNGTINIKPGTLNNTTLNNLYTDSNNLYFTYTVDNKGNEPWKSNGTDEGTAMLKDINIVTSGSAISGSFPSGFVRSGNNAFFIADDGIHGVEIWKTDGTTAGTSMLKDISPDGTDAPFSLVDVNGTLFFSGPRSQNRYYLWKSDGTVAGTISVGNTNTANTFDAAQNMTNVNGTLFFTGRSSLYGNELWKTDGTDTGTVLVKDMTPGNSSILENLTNVDGILFFTKINVGPYNRSLWKSDGTAEGTVEVKNIRPGTADPMIGNLTSFNGKLYFTANDGVHGPELWVSDGTEAGTVMIEDLVPGTEGANPGDLKAIGNSLYFSVGNGNVPIAGMYKTDGTVNGTIAIANGSGGPYFANQEQFTLIDSTVFFRANGLQIWKVGINDTVAIMVKNIPYTTLVTDPRPQFLTAVNGTLFFSAADNVGGQELWKSDGTEAGTLSLDIVPGTAHSSAKYLTRFNNSLLFAATDPLHGEELWILKNEPCTWTGNESTAWETPGNWSTNEVPSVSSVVIIPSGRPRYPVISVSTTVKRISCAEASSVTVLSGVVLNVLK